MKKLLFLAVFFTASHCFAQYNDSAKLASDAKKDRIDLHLAKYDNEYKTGRDFLYTGAGVMTIGALCLFAKSNSAIPVASSIGFIGGVFSIYGFFTMVDSYKHMKKVKWIESGSVARK